MPKPEIDRRCPSCGISIRVRASFCPECGKPLPPKSDPAMEAKDAGALTPVTQELTAEMAESAATQPLDSSAAIEPIDSFAATMPLDSPAAIEPIDSIAATMPLDSFAPTIPLDSPTAIKPLDAPAATMPLDSHAATKPLESRNTVAPPAVLSTLPSAPRKHPRQATVGMDRRAGPPQRELIDEDGLNRVEKFRQMSTAMIDEAAYDPSLRFVLVAAVLFVLFLLLVLASELIT